MTIDYDKAAALLIAARRDARPIDRLPEDCRPSSFDEAYAIQDRVVRAFGTPVGWKAGGGKGPVFCAPVAAPFVRPSGAVFEAAPLHDLGLEIEFAFRLEKDFPVSALGYDEEEILSSVSFCPLIEFLGSRYVDREKLPVPEKLADAYANGGFVVGTPIRDWRHIDFTRQQAVLRIDGVVAQHSTTISGAGEPLSLVVWQVNHCARRGGMKAGDIVTTGALAGVSTIAAGSVAEADYGDYGVVSVSFR